MNFYQRFLVMCVHRSALTEVCALIDVLAIARDRERRYMTLEHIASDQPPEIRVAGPFVVGKKKVGELLSTFKGL